MRLFLKIIAVLLVACLTLTGVGAQEAGQVQIVVVSEPLFDSEIGMIRADVALRDAEGASPDGLNEANFTLDIPLNALQVTARPELPLTLAVIVDTSAGSEIDLIRSTLLAYFEHYYRTGDEVALYIVEDVRINQRRFRVEAIDSLERAQAVLNELVGGESFFFVSPALEAALADLQDVEPLDFRSRQALFVGSFLNRPADAQVAAAFVEAGIPLHVVQAHRTHDGATEIYRQFARSGGGLFANNRDGLFVVGENHEPVNLLKVLYDAVENSRLVYSVEFRPAAVSATQPEDVGLTVTLPDGSSAQTRFSYTLDLSAPQVSFSNPEELQVELAPAVGEDGVLTFDRQMQPVSVEVVFPDHFARPLAELTLTVNVPASDEPPQVFRILNPQTDPGGILRFDWPLGPFQRLDDTALSFEVAVTDMAGLTGNATSSGEIRVLPVSGGVVVPTVVAAAPDRPDSGAVSSVFDGGNTTQLLLAVNVVLLLAALVLAAAAFARRRRTMSPSPVTYVTVPATSQPAPVPAPVGGNGSSLGITPEQQANVPGDLSTYAKLIVRNGLDEVGGQQQILMRDAKFVIGSGSACHLIINQPYVSPEHCQINWRGGRLYVRDNSKNGTYVNGERVPYDDEIDVPLGSEIGITKKITMEIHRSDYVFMSNDAPVVGSTAHSTVMSDEVNFPRLPGLRYAPDDGPPIDDNFNPV